ncbi:hypothetical protein WDU99_15015 [Microbacterium sp. Mu-80]|uniref:Uncharacterized protein n=1 Tax=Microbacterium bandirmense TaxID=3122050 RepID=A0ABU8LFA9_9MICO
MTLPHADIDPDGLLEYSVVFTDRSLNHMSARFVGIMQQTIDLDGVALNNRPRKILGWTTPVEVFAEQIHSLKTDDVATIG